MSNSEINLLKTHTISIMNHIYNWHLRLFDIYYTGKQSFVMFNEINEIIRKERGVYAVSFIFYNLSRTNHLNAAIMCLANLYDDHPDCKSILKFFDQMKEHKRIILAKGQKSDQEFNQLIADIENDLKKLVVLIGDVTTIRDRYIAHIDKKRLTTKMHEVVLPEKHKIEMLFNFSFKIINTFAYLYENVNYYDPSDHTHHLRQTIECVNIGLKKRYSDLRESLMIGPYIRKVEYLQNYYDEILKGSDNTKWKAYTKYFIGKIYEENDQLILAHSQYLEALHLMDSRESEFQMKTVREAIRNVLELIEDRCLAYMNVPWIF